jgi:hypothetical protein
MAGLRDMLLRQREETMAKLDGLAKEAAARRQAWIEAVKLFDGATAELKRIDLESPIGDQETPRL